jgi:GT2 family glycosyltransferase
VTVLGDGVPFLASIVIPNWNGAQHLRTCLDSLRVQTYPELEIIVADNGSTDGSLALLAREYADVAVVALGKNLGFAGACNAGIRTSRGEFILLLNNDTEAHARWVQEVVGAFDRHPEAGIVASKMLLFDRRDVFHAAGDLYRRDGTPGNRGVWRRDEGQFQTEEMVFGANGGSAAYRRTMLNEIGLLDVDFFYSCEDVDLAWRAQLAGWRCVYAPRAVVYHKLSATGGGTTASFYDGRNMLYVLAKDYPAELWRSDWPAIVRAQLRITLQALRAWRGEAARARIRGQIAGLAGLARMLRKRREAQGARVVSREYIESILSAVDETP